MIEDIEKAVKDIENGCPADSVVSNLTEAVQSISGFHKVAPGPQIEALRSATKGSTLYLWPKRWRPTKEPMQPSEGPPGWETRFIKDTSSADSMWTEETQTLPTASTKYTADDLINRLETIRLRWGIEDTALYIKETGVFRLIKGILSPSVVATTLGKLEKEARERMDPTGRATRHIPSPLYTAQILSRIAEKCPEEVEMLKEQLKASMQAAAIMQIRGRFPNLAKFLKDLSKVRGRRR